MICIYNKDESNFNNNGLAVLEPIECTYKPIINQTWALEMTLPYDNDRKFDYIQNERILKVTGIDCVREFSSTTQFFRIADFKKMDADIYVLAYPIGLDARFDTFVRDINMYNKVPADAISMINALSDKYTVSTSGVGVVSNSMRYQNANIISILSGPDSTIRNADGSSSTYHNFVQTYDAEICYDNYNIKVNGRLGDSTNPIDIRYGKNIMGLNYGLDASNTISRLYPRANSGEYLNDVADYKIANNPYVDADDASQFPIPHIYYCDTPYNLVQLSNDGSLEWGLSSTIYDNIRNYTRYWLHQVLLYDDLTDGLLKEIELEWLVNNYALTTSRDGVEGLCEYMWRNIIYMNRGFNNTHNIISGSVQSLIYSAMKAGFDDVLINENSEYYIGSSAKKVWDDGSYQFYSYTWDDEGTFRVNENGDNTAWVYANSKWNAVNTSGYFTGTTDKNKWKWYKVKNQSKRYGYKKKSRYLRQQWWKVNDVWYWFNNLGEGKKGSWLTATYYPYFDDAEILFDPDEPSKTFYDVLVPICVQAEHDLFQNLYTLMTNYCERLFDTEGLSKPALTLEVNMVDLSKTTEYANYQFLERVHLGDAVKIYHPKLGPEPTTLRIVGLTYDVLKECNTEIQIGVTATSVINLLNSIGSSNNDTKLVFGDSFEIVNNKIEVKPPATPYLEDVLVNGESVVRNHKAYVDLEEMGIGLQWFEEQEESLYGMEVQTDSLAENPKFYVDHPIAMHIDETSRFGSKYNYYFKSLNTDSSVIACGYQGAKIATMYNPPAYDDGFLVISKNQSTAGFEYWNNNGTHQTYNWSSSTEVTQRLDWNTCEGYGMSTTFSYEDETYYATLSCSNYRAEWTKQYEVDGVVGWNTDYGASGEFDTMADFCKAVLEANISVDKYNGLARDEKLAFFAGAEDENGTDAKVAIWTDGKVKGLVADVQKNGESVVDEKGVASIPDSASSVAELTDVELTDLADKEILEWDAEAEKWKNVANSGGGGGAGGSSVYSEKILWEDANGYTSDAHASVTLTDSLLNYDAIVIEVSRETDREYRNQEFILVSMIDKTGNTWFPLDMIGTETNRVVTCNYVDETHLILGHWTYQRPVKYYKIVGLKFGTLSPIIYSEEEREVGVWIDNKPLYARTFNITPTIVKTSATLISEIDISNMQVMVNGYGVSQTYGQMTSLALYNDNGLKVVADLTIQIDKIVIYYTKTTDVAGSGKYNTLGVPTIHYTTDEQIIGTWVDGKPLYERSFFVDSPTANTTTIIQDASFSNIKYVVKTQGVYQRATSGHIVFDTIGSYENSNYSSFCRVVKASPNASEVGFAYYIKIATGNTISNLCMTIQYTKTTD